MPARADYLLRCVRRMASQASPAPDDSGLLTRFLAGRDPAAFEALVARHGPMVLRVCQHVLGNRHDAEDAFQATFLVLARKGASVRPPGALAAWLHGVAYRVALGARAVANRRHREAPTPDLDPADPRPDPLSELTAREALRILEEEVQRLPEAYRLPVILCCLEGRTREEAARQLGWTAGLVKGRLERGRKRLHQRLTRRGLELAVVLALVEVSHAGAAGFRRALVASTASAAVAFSAGGPAGTRAVPADLAALAEEGLRGPSALKAGVGLTAVLLLGVAAAGAGALAPQAPVAKEPPPTQEAEAQAAATLESRSERPPGTDDYGDPLPGGAIARMGTARFREGGAIFTLAYSPDGKVLASGSGSRWGVIHLWDVATGKELSRLQPNEGEVYSVAFSPDGKSLASIGTGKENRGTAIHVWEVATGKQIQTLPHAESVGYTVAFSPDGRRLAAGGCDGRVRLWDLKSGRQVVTLKGHTGIVWDCAFAPDGARLGTASKDGTIRLWDPTTGQERLRLADPRRSWSSVAFSPDSSVVAGGSDEGTVTLWDAATGREQLRVAGHDKWRNAGDCSPDGPNVVAFSPDGQALAAGHEGVVLDTATGRVRCQLQGHHRWLRSLAFSPDGKMLAGEDTHRVRFWDAATGAEIFKDRAHRDPVCCLAFSPDSRTLATTSWDDSVGLWDVRTGRERFRFQGRVKPRIHHNHVALAADGRTLAAWLGDVLYSWDIGDPSRAREFSDPGAGNCRRGVAFSPRGRLIAAAWRAEGERLRIWGEGTAKAPLVLAVRPHGSNGLVVSPDGKTLASGFPDGTAGLWDVPTGKELRTFEGFRPEGPGRAVFSLAFSPDGKTLALGSSDGAIGLWDKTSGQELYRFEGSRQFVNALAYSPDGRTLAAGHEDGMVRLWETASGQLRRQWRVPGASIRSLAFSWDGRLLATGCSDTTALVWVVTGGLAEGRSKREGLSAKALEALWTDLASPDAAKAYQAVGAMTASGQAVPFLKARLRAVAAVNSEAVARLLSALDDERFPVREKATAELARLGELAEPALRKALADPPSPEVRRRAQGLLERLSLPSSPERLRDVRAVEALEQIGSSQARDALKVLAAGAPEARLTREAKASLERLSKRHSVNP